MSTVTSNSTVAGPMAKRSVAHSTIRIEPPRGLLNLPLKELWDYRELLHFFVWRDVKVRYKQTAIGVRLGRSSAAPYHARCHSFLRQTC